MSTRYPGGLITKTPVVPSGPYVCGTAPGIWTIDQVLTWQKAGLWPSATGGQAPGTFAIFAIGRSSCCASSVATKNKYTYSGDVNSIATSATCASRYQSAAGNSTRGIFALGQTPVNAVSTRNKHTYSGCVVSSATSASIANWQGSAAGNSTTGIFALSYNSSSTIIATRNKYTYSSDTNGTAAAASVPSREGSAAGTSTVGIFALASFCCCGSLTGTATRDKYTYSSCTNGSATSASTAGGGLGAASGNSTVGIFAIGGATTTRNKYTYSGDVNAVATASSAGSGGGSAAGNSTIGIFAIGQNLTTRNKYTYSGDTSVSATASSITTLYGSATSNGTTGVNI